LEAGPLSQWLYSALAEAGFPVICVERTSRHFRSVPTGDIAMASLTVNAGGHCALYPHA
jgi:transposase